MNDHVKEQNERGDILRRLEFACWVAVGLMPFLCWVNGPAVSMDQAVVRTALVLLGLGGGIVLRIVNWRRKARSERGAIASEDQRTTTSTS